MDKIIQGDCIEVLKTLPDGIIDMVLTSPPYDNLRDYNKSLKWGEDVWKPVINELYRVVKNGGVVVWVVGDATIKGSETGTSFKQALYFKEIGFNLHDTMVYEKNSSAYPSNKNSLRCSQIFEYMFVFSKGKPKTVNLILDKKNKWAGHTSFDGKIPPVPEYSPRNNIWRYTTSFNDKTGHPAVFPEQLAKDHITTWSNEGDVILDPFAGSGTTGKAAKVLGRNYILIEKELEYIKIAERRLSNIEQSLFL